jgi:hypothetical protein
VSCGCNTAVRGFLIKIKKNREYTICTFIYIRAVLAVTALRAENIFCTFISCFICCDPHKHKNNINKLLSAQYSRWVRVDSCVVFERRFDAFLLDGGIHGVAVSIEQCGAVLHRRLDGVLLAPFVPRVH